MPPHDESPLQVNNLTSHQEKKPGKENNKTKINRKAACKLHKELPPVGAPVVPATPGNPLGTLLLLILSLSEGCHC